MLGPAPQLRCGAKTCELPPLRGARGVFLPRRRPWAQRLTQRTEGGCGIGRLALDRRVKCQRKPVHGKRRSCHPPDPRALPLRGGAVAAVGRRRAGHGWRWRRRRRDDRAAGRDGAGQDHLGSGRGLLRNLDRADRVGRAQCHGRLGDRHRHGTDLGACGSGRAEGCRARRPRTCCRPRRPTPPRPRPAPATNAPPSFVHQNALATSCCGRACACRAISDMA